MKVENGGLYLGLSFIAVLVEDEVNIALLNIIEY
jgi:hypothetical protein